MNSPQHFSGTIRSNLKELSHLTDQVEDWGLGCALPQKPLWTLCMILDELITNTIVHGYSNKDGQPIDVSIDATAEAIRLTLKDYAPAFNPLAAPEADTAGDIDDRDIGGLGIHFVRKMTSAASYSHDGTANEIRLTINMNNALNSSE